MFRRVLLLLFILTLSGGALRAQESAGAKTFKQRLRGEYLHSDTAQAIINLYGTRQAGGASWILAAGLAALRIATASGGTGSSYGGTAVRDNGNNGGLAFLLATPIVAYGAGKLVHYSNGRLQRVLTNYAAGQPLAPGLRRKLKPRFFAQPIIQYQPVNARPAK